MATLAPVPKYQFFDNNGNPLVGGKLYTYVAGTTTPKTTYTDQSAAAANTNPIILDSRGEANVWLGTGAYKLKLTTALDVDVWTVDNIGAQLTTNDLAIGIQAWLSTPTSANLRAAMLDETGSGALVFANTPTLVTPAVDVITEATPGVGVTIDGVVLKDSDVSAQDVTGSATVNAPIINATGTSSSGGIVRLFEDTDNGTNYVELRAPATLAANRAFVLPSADGTAQQFLKTDGSGNLAFAAALVSGTLVTATNQTAIEFTSLPSWVKRITVSLESLGTNSGIIPQIQLSSGGSYKVTGYTQRGYVFTITPGYAAWANTTGFAVAHTWSTAVRQSGYVTLVLQDAPTNKWIYSQWFTDPAATSNAIWVANGFVSLSGAIDALRLYINGTDQFNAGSVNILYE